MTTLYIAAFAIAGAVHARRDAREGKLMSKTAGVAVWGVTALFFLVFALFGVPGSPEAWTVLFMPIGYHLAAARIASAHQKETEAGVAPDTKIL